MRRRKPGDNRTDRERPISVFEHLIWAAAIGVAFGVVLWLLFRLPS